MTDLIKYSPDFIFKFKTSNIFTDELKSYFDTVKEYMTSGTDSKDFKIKVKNDKIELNSTKWYRKRFITYDEKTKKNINYLLNKLTEKNYRDITKKILQLELNSYEIVKYLVDNIIDKCLLESQYILRWSFLIKEIVFNNLDKWTYNNTYIYQIFLNFCQSNFEIILKTNYHSDLLDLYDNDIDAFYKKKNYNNNLMLLLAELFKLKLLNINILKIIVNELTCNIDEYYKLELALILVDHLLSTSDGKKLYNEKIRLLLDNNKLNKKIKFMILDIEDKMEIKVSNELESKKESDSLAISEFTPDEEIEVKIRNIIREYISENDIEYTLSCYSEIKSKPRSNKVIYEFLINLLDSDSKKFNLIFGLLKKLIKNKAIKYNNIKFGFIDFFNEYDDLLLDYPNLDDNISEILGAFIKSKVIDYNTTKFILNKGLNSSQHNKGEGDKYNYFISKLDFKSKKI